ncbi:EF-hand domain-containing protein [Streptacidiphilus griseoplanus]|uniref:EF-hand domain-containing protein n=1 Tax=Peterkaempfera griseoplana TaxID=66896 RepID=UPI000B1C0B86|nr:EF-hand domain-containing protein [Peterkaempfera griseoplana]
MASAFQERKLKGMFAAFDTDSDGCLREEDFRALTDRWSRLPGVGPGTELRARGEELLMGWWAALLEVGDANGDGTVDMGELLMLVDRLPALVADVTATANTVFDAVDANRDGRISPEEHRRLVETWNGQPST